ncbi:MAG: hypothetical protein L0Z70_04570 [Chloroflexi bacterium]|nr:hypothetical protein [Chloroflexota bacterium]
MTSQRILSILLLALIFILPTSALAQHPSQAPDAPPTVLTIAGSPLKIYAASDASIQVWHSAVSDVNITGLVYSALETIADAGIFVNYNNGVADFSIGPDFNQHNTSAANFYDPWSSVSHTLSGAGTASSPWTASTLLSHQSGVSMTLQTSYVNGEDFFSLTWEICTGNHAAVTTFLAADVALEDDSQVLDSSVGAYNSASGAVGALNPVSGWAMAYTPIAPAASHHWAGSALLTSPPTLWDKIGATGAPGNGLDDTVNAAAMDNGIALQWNLPAANCNTVSARWQVTPPGGSPNPALRALFLPQVHN